jgi:hypothetical protein
MARRLFIVAFIVSLASACSDRTPTGSSPLEPAPGVSTVYGLAGSGVASARALFDCSSLEEVRVRFSDPGFLDHLRVGLYVNYTGLPDGQKRLRIWWDYVNAYDEVEDVIIDEAVDRIGGREVYENVFEHRYEGVDAPTARQVRAELMILGSEGSCARNRDIVVLPAAPVTEDSSGKPCGGRACSVFLTSTRHNGNLGGVAGGDAICQTRADAAGLGGNFKAWLSDDSDSPASRFSRATTPYVLPNGTRIANDWNDLTDGSIAHHIDVTELGASVSGIKTVWTRTFPNGESASFSLGPDCQAWSNASSGHFGTNGLHEGSLSLWSFIGASSCNAQLRLYCFQQ